MKIAILTNEYPPNVYGGAGVHVEYLVKELSRIQRDVEAIKVLCFGNQESRHENVQVRGVDIDMQYTAPDLHHPGLLGTLIRDVAMAGSVESADIIHCHTWYTHFAGCLLKQLTGGKLVLTTHSLEPHRPWKREQLGTAYNVSSWMEKTAYENADGIIAVSQSMRSDVFKLYGIAEDRIRVIHNGIDTEEYRPQLDPAALKRYGINPEKPFILFVGRITRQKGILHLVNAIPYIRSDVQIVLCAGAADTREIEQEMSMRVAHSQERSRNEIIWIPKVVPKPDIINIYSAAAVFVCPSIYEPFGIINLEAMACSTPVVASAVGGIPEIVIPEETGRLVRFAAVGSGNPEPEDPDQFSRDLASAIDSLLQAPEKIHAMGKKARERVEEQFSWKSIARQTLDFYQQLLQSGQ
jgi:alpha-maltose-1-phosphate synthase